MRKERIIVTGGAGFIGSHVTDAYLAAGHRVAVIDNLTSGFRKNISTRAVFYKADIRSAADMRKVLRRERPTIVNHHAAVVEVVKSIRDPRETLETNVLGTANILAAATEAKIKKIIFASTGGAIYGEPKKIPADERTPSLPLSPYGLSKLLDEELIKFYARLNGFTYTILRYSNIYGPRQNPNGEAGVVAIFGALVKAGKRPTIFGDGTKIRDYTYVGDVARSNLLALKKGVGQIINIGSGKEVQDQEIFDTIARELNFRKPARYKPYRKGEVYRITIDAKKARRTLGWKPNIQLQEGIRKTLQAL